MSLFKALTDEGAGFMPARQREATRGFSQPVQTLAGASCCLRSPDNEMICPGYSQYCSFYYYDAF